MKQWKQLELPLLPPAHSPSVFEIAEATKGMDIFDPLQRGRIIEAVSKLYGLDVMRMNPRVKGVWEFAEQCFEDAFLVVNINTSIEMRR